MTVKVKLFGAIAEIIGSGEVVVPAVGSTVSEIVELLTTNYPALAKLPLKYAVNQEYASSETVVGWSDEVAIFTAVSGG